ncbi:hypothetical protein FP2506_00180 [Fulvimarina pelagi HTCC2506]|uniref:Uncharacterized protein n=1 Tax=Fulvimarina pelagi HTCC2506 TaxID=314231 RepID=Q0FXU9_9HYPH|nr:copper-binding protein [Fulvimarina pelagi]EAU39784.1 hypothetical protein FP2506_00180 [Fulvimarina pelagi HTCC2506]
MKTIIKLAFAAIIAASAAMPAMAAEFTAGTIQKVDTKAKKITIKHGPLTNLDMPGMTMVFSVADPAMLEKAKEGSNIQFIADRVRGKLTVVEMK